MRTGVVLAAMLLLAGCSQPQAEDDAAAAPDSSWSLSGVVVDESITPLSGVTVRLSGAGVERNTTTSDGGAWTFGGLPAGDYLVRADRSGYFGTQTQASVGTQPGGADPPLVRLVMAVDQAQVPAVEAFVFEGFLQCSATALLLRQACNANELARPVCDATGACGDNLTEDRFLAQHTFSRPGLAFVQSELQWDPSSNLGENLRAVPGARDPDSGQLQDFEGVDGGPPLILSLDAQVANALGLGAGKDYVVRVFNSHAPGTAPPCLPSPVGCPFGVGLSTQQRFTMVTHAFYGFTPPAEWQFGRDGLPAVPPP